MLKLIRKLRLPGRPFPLSVSGDGRRFATCVEPGECLLFDHDLRQLDRVDLGIGVKWIQLNEDGSQLIVGFGDHIRGYSFLGNLAPQFKFSVPGTTYSGCTFRDDPKALCVASCGERALMMAWNIETCKIIDEVELPDRGWGGGYMLNSHPEGEAMAAVAFSGQSEEWMFWTHFAQGKLRVFEHPEMVDVAYPCFHPAGGEFVSFHDRLGLCRMTFPAGEMIGSVRSEEAFDDQREESFGYNMHYARDNHFLVWLADLALYEFDLRTLRPVRTVLTGVEGMTFGQDRFFSGGSYELAEGRLITFDTHWGASYDDRIDTLRLWDASELLGPPIKPDSDRPYTKALLAS